MQNRIFFNCAGDFFRHAMLLKAQLFSYLKICRPTELRTRWLPPTLSLQPCHVFLFYVQPFSDHITGFCFYILSGILAIFILSSNNSNNILFIQVVKFSSRFIYFRDPILHISSFLPFSMQR